MDDLDPEMPRPIPTEPRTVTELAAVLQVHRRQISKWRDPRHEQHPAPSSLSLRAWSHWLRRSARGKWAARADARLAEIEDAGGRTTPAPLAITLPADTSGEQAAAVGGEQGAAWLPLEPDASDAQREARAKAQRAESAALRERLELQTRLGDVIPATALTRLCEALGAAIAEHLQSGVWPELSPLLDGLDGELRRRLHAAHGAGILRQRRDLAAAIREQVGAALRAQLTGGPRP